MAPPSNRCKAERLLEEQSDSDFHTLTHMDKGEFCIIGPALATTLSAVTFRAGSRLGFTTLDIIRIIIAYCPGSQWPFASGGCFFGASPMAISRIIRQAIHLSAIVARRLWMPPVQSARLRLLFFPFPGRSGCHRYNTYPRQRRLQSVQAKSSFLEEVLLPLLEDSLRRRTEWQCLWFALFALGRRHDKRILDESDAATVFRHIDRVESNYV
jgi:hypothetical protein